MAGRYPSSGNSFHTNPYSDVQQVHYAVDPAAMQAALEAAFAPDAAFPTQLQEDPATIAGEYGQPWSQQSMEVYMAHWQSVQNVQTAWPSQAAVAAQAHDSHMAFEMLNQQHQQQIQAWQQHQHLQEMGRQMYAQQFQQASAPESETEPQGSGAVQAEELMDSAGASTVNSSTAVLPEEQLDHYIRRAVDAFLAGAPLVDGDSDEDTIEIEVPAVVGIPISPSTAEAESPYYRISVAGPTPSTSYGSEAASQPQSFKDFLPPNPAVSVSATTMQTMSRPPAQQILASAPPMAPASAPASSLPAPPGVHAALPSMLRGQLPGPGTSLPPVAPQKRHCVDPDCLKRGFVLSRKLARLPLPPGIQETQIPQMRRILTGVLEVMVNESMRPTFQNLQQKLRVQGMNDTVVETLLLFCAREPLHFVLSVEKDATVVIYMPGQEGECLHDEEAPRRTFNYKEHSFQLLERLVCRVNSMMRTMNRGTTSEAPPPGNPAMTAAATKLAAMSAISIPVLDPSLLASSTPAGFNLVQAEQAGQAVPQQLLSHTVTNMSMPHQHLQQLLQQQMQGNFLPEASAPAGSGAVHADLVVIDRAGDQGQPPPSMPAKLETCGLPCGTTLILSDAIEAASQIDGSALSLDATFRAQGIQTLMVRNIPASITQKRFIEELCATGFTGSFDFCYMPSMFGSGVGKGYAFVNLTTTQAAASLAAGWHGTRRFGISAAEPALNCSAAALQGREKNAKKWDAPRMRRVRNPQLRPLVIQPGVTSSAEALGSFGIIAG